MPKAAECPEMSAYQHLVANPSVDGEQEALLGHLETCDACAKKLGTLLTGQDTLVDLIRQAKPHGDRPQDENIARLIERLTKLKPLETPTESPTEEKTLAPAASLAFPCPACGKKLQVQASLAGAKVKCPNCQQVMQAPVARREENTLPTKDVVAAPQPPPAPGGNTVVQPVDVNSELTEFLAPAQAPDELGRLGPYRILKILGAGGMGVVYKAEDPQLKRLVALKAILPGLGASSSAKKRFLREAQSAAAIKHDHIVTIHQVGEENGIPFLAMEFLKGEPLDERLKREEKLPLAEVLRIGREMADGLAAAHEAGLIHRDIKPANVWLEERQSQGRKRPGDKETGRQGDKIGHSPGLPVSLSPGLDFRVKILDFGLARATDEQQNLTQSGAIIGTPAYMAPEQARGAKCDHRCDLFSLGVVLYRLCTGNQPFRGDDTISTLMAVATEEPPAPVLVDPELPQELSDLVMKLLEKDLTERLGSANEAVEILQALEKAQGEPSRVSGRVERQVASQPGPSRGSARRPVAQFAVALLAVVGLLLGGAGVYYWQTNNGIVRIEINDENIKVAFDKNGPIISGADKHDIKLTPGEFGLTVERGDLKFDTDKFILKRGETITLKIEWFKEGKLQVVQAGKGVIGAKDLPPVPIASVPIPDGFALRFDGCSAVDLTSLTLDDKGPFTLEAYATADKGELREDRANYVIAAPGQVSLKLFPRGRWVGAVMTTEGPPDGLKFMWPVATFPPERRTHLALVRSGTEWRLFIDGKLWAKTEVTEVPVAFTSTFVIGEGFNGVISEVRVSKSARYDKNFKPSERFHPDADTVGLYHFDEASGTVLKDSSGNGHHGKIVGAKWVKADGLPIAPAPPAVDYALRFNGASHADLPDPALDVFKPFTLETFAVLEKLPPTERHAVYLVRNTGAFDLRLATNKGFWSFMRLGPSAGNPLVGSAVVGKRVHLAGVYDGKEIRLYVDGKLVRSNPAEKESSVPTNKYSLGDIDFVGLLDEIRISKVARYDKDFTPQTRFEPDADTLALYHCDEGAGDKLTDSSGNGHHGKIVGAKWVNADGTPIAPPVVRGQHALQFSGKSKVEFPTLQVDPVKPFTLEGWITPDVQGGSKARHFMEAGGLARLRVIEQKGVPVWSFLLGVEGSGSAAAEAPLAIGKRVHVAGVRVSTEIRLYVDGKLVASKKIKDGPLNAADRMASLGGHVKAAYFLGLIGEVRFSQGARYDKDFTPAKRFESDADTLALYHCDEGSGDVLKDSSGNGHHGKIIGAKWVKADGTAIESPHVVTPPVAASDYALSFDGVGVVELPSLKLDNSSPFTLEAYVIPKNNNDGKRLHTILGSKTHSGLHIESYQKSPGPGRPAEYSEKWEGSASGKGSEYIVEGGPVVQGKRVHVAAVVASSGQMSFFIDGKLQFGSTTFKNPTGINEEMFTIGGKMTNPFSGIIGEVRVSKVARYANDFKNFTPKKRFEPDADTLALYHFDEGSGDVLKDSSGNGHHGKIVGAKWVKADGTAIAPAFFNGKDLAGWVGKPGHWRVENGDIVGAFPAGVERKDTTLYTEQMYGDFELSFRAQLKGNGLSAGLNLRDPVKSPDAGYILWGPAIGLIGNNPGTLWSGNKAILASKPGADKTGKEGELDAVTIRCVGKRLTVVFNGVIVTDGEADLAPEGRIGWQLKADTKTEFRIKDLRFTDLTRVPVGMTPEENAAKKLQEDWAARLKVPVEATNKTGMKLTLIPPAGDALPKPYYLGKYEVAGTIV